MGLLVPTWFQDPESNLLPLCHVYLPWLMGSLFPPVSQKLEQITGVSLPYLLN